MVTSSASATLPWCSAPRAERRKSTGSRERSLQVPELVMQLTRAGFLVLLWLFILAALRVVRSDLYAAAGLKVSVPGFRRSSVKGGGKAPRQLVVTRSEEHTSEL